MPPTSKKDKAVKADKAPKKPTLLAMSNNEERFDTAGVDRDLCTQCGMFEKGVSGYYVPFGYSKKVFLLFGTPPSEDALHLIYRELALAGYPHADIAYMAAIRCPADDPTMTQIRACRPYVLRALGYLQPSLVFALGAEAAKSLTNSGTGGNVAKKRGRPFQVKGCQVYVTYAPSSVLAGGSQYLIRIQEDVRRKKLDETPRPGPLHPEGLYIGFDTEYAPDKTLLTIGLANMTDAISVEPGDAQFYPALARIEEIPTLCGHSVTGDVDQLVEMELAKPEWVSGEYTRDSLLMARMLDENRGTGGYDLESLMCSARNVQPWKKATELISKEDATLWPVDLRKERCRLDAWASVHLVHDMLPLVANQPLTLTHEIAMSLHRIRHAGVYIDSLKLEEMGHDLDMARQQARAKLTIAAQGHGMSEFIPTNDAHIRDLLFKRMKLKVTKKTRKTKLAAVDQITLKQFEQHREVQLLTAFNKADKAYTTNILGVQEHSTPVDGTSYRWMAVNINPLGARTGRRSSSRPNMQNWPVPLRQIVVSRFPGGKILEFDYKSLEVFILAFESGDMKLFDYFNLKGGYIAVAKEMWKTDIQKGTPQYRATKVIVLGTHYNMQTPMMANNLWTLGIHLSEDYKEHERKTDTLRNRYLDMFPGLRTYMARQERCLLKYQRVESRTGRVRHLPLTDGEETPGYRHMVNQAINFPIQSLASDVTGSALIDCESALTSLYDIELVEYHKRLMHKDWPVMPLIINEVHDSLVFDLPNLGEQKEREIVGILKETMESSKTLRQLCPSFDLPLKVDTKLGGHWGIE